MKKPRSKVPKPRLWRPVLAAALLGAGAGLAAVYGIGGLQRNGTPAQADAGCEGAVEAARRLRPLVHGEIAALTLSEIPRRVPDLSFRDGEGKPVRLADFRGRRVLLNLWATWCVPCRKEMPALDRLQGRMNGKDFVVVAVNIDTGDPAKPHPGVEARRPGGRIADLDPGRPRRLRDRLSRRSRRMVERGSHRTRTSGAFALMHVQALRSMARPRPSAAAESVCVF